MRKIALFCTLLILTVGTIGCMKPMYVATIGAGIYHMPDCQYVENSMEEYGPIKRLNYHSTLHKDLSGREPCPKCIK